MNQSARVSPVADAKLRTVIEQMPIVQTLVRHLKFDGFKFDEGALLFGVQHLMEQSLVFCWALNELGLSYDRMALAGKPYSTDTSVCDQLTALGVMVQEPRVYDLSRAQSQEQVEDIRRLALRFATRKQSLFNATAIVVDDGGHALSHFTQFVPQPYRLAGVEQTASGFWQPGFHTVSFPVVDVGASGVKRICEPKAIASAAIRRVRKLLPEDIQSKEIGIIGLGYIGNALLAELRRLNLDPITFDVRSAADGPRKARTIRELFDKGDIIFGCTGMDVTRSMVLDRSEISRRGERQLVSLSSGDDEFFSLKAEFVGEAGFKTSYDLGGIPDICGERWGASFRILRNGFPINFDNSGISVPLDQIQGTIAALVAATCQTYRSATSAHSVASVGQRTMLDTRLQRWLFRQWAPHLSDIFEPDVGQMQNLDEIARLSTERTTPTSIQGEAIFGAWTELRR